MIPQREAQLLLAHVLDKPREWVIAHPEQSLTPEQQTRFTDLTTQAANGVPLPYLLGHWEFFGLDFVVTPDVLIPRPETELLVEKSQISGTAREQHAKSQNPKIVDVGTGSGIIAVTLAIKLPLAQLTATDISPAALAVAQTNAQRHHVADRITFIESDLLSASPFLINHLTFDIILANLPYIPSNDLVSLAVTQHEPALALDGGPDGLGLIRRLLTEAPRLLAPGGRILLEIEYRQGAAVSALARNIFPTAQVQVHQDLAGLDRVVEVNTNRNG